MKQRLSLSMIVRNEEIHLARCLETARLFADEIIVVDTGSTDATRDIAGRFADRVCDFAWVDDFARARNYSLQQCTGEFVMYLDADDVFSEQSARELRALLDKPVSWDILRLPYMLGTDGRGGLTMSLRVWRNFSGIRWQFPIHEVLDAPRGSRVEFLPSGPRVIHWPLRAEERRPEKRERNLRILTSALESEAHKDSPHLLFHLAKEYRRGPAEEAERAIDALRRSLDLQPERGTFMRSRHHYMIAETHRHLGRDDDALAALGQAIGEYPLWREPFWLMSEILKARRQPSGAVALLQMAGQIPQHRNHLHKAELYGPEWHRIVSQALELAGDLPAALDEVRAALRHHPDHASLLEREAELVRFQEMRDSPPRLLELEVVPATARPGDELEVRFTLYSRRPARLGLGLSLRHGQTGATLNDPAHDTLVDVPPGESEQSRLFVLPADAAPGTYDLDSAVRFDAGGRLGKVLDRLTLARKVVVRG